MAGWAGLTIEAWIKFERSAATHAATIVSNLPQPPVPSGQAGVQLGITFPAGVLQGYVTTAAGKLVGGTFPDLTIDGNWHEIALTYDPYFGLRGYLDGKVSATRFLSSATLAATASAPLLVGGSGSSASDHYRGWIDDLRVSSTKRDPAWLVANVTDVLRPAQFYTIGSEQHLQ